MSIKPIDLQVAIPRTSEMANNQNDAIHRNIALQQQQAGTVENLARMNTKQVHSQDTAGKISFDEKGNGRNNGNGGENKKRKDGGGHEQGQNQQPHHGRIDIRI